MGSQATESQRARENSTALHGGWMLRLPILSVTRKEQVDHTGLAVFSNPTMMLKGRVWAESEYQECSSRRAVGMCENAKAFSKALHRYFHHLIPSCDQTMSNSRKTVSGIFSSK